MFAINLSVIFAFGLVVTAIALKGMMQAQEFARIDEELQQNKYVSPADKTTSEQA